MKIRTGFVSNSSSSCFILGDRWKKSDIKRIKNELEIVVDFYNKLFKEDQSFEDVFQEPRLATKEDIELLDRYIGYYNQDKEFWSDVLHIKKGEENGRILIFSSEDNSIPYQFFGLIESIFEGERIHLG